MRRRPERGISGSVLIWDNVLLAVANFAKRRSHVGVTKEAKQAFRSDTACLAVQVRESLPLCANRAELTKRSAIAMGAHRHDCPPRSTTMAGRTALIGPR